MDDALLEQSSISILRDKSKDIRILIFLSFSYLKQEQWERYADVFEGLATLIEQNFEKLFPDRDRGKQLAFKWISETRYALLLEEKKPTGEAYEHITRILSGLTKIKPVLEQKFPDGSPFPSELYRFVQQWERSCKPKENVPPPPPPIPPVGRGTTEVSVGAQTSPGTLPPSSPADIADTKQAQILARKAALFLIEKERNKPMGYRLIRSVRWDIIEKSPPSEGGKIKLEGPNPQQRTYFQKLCADKEWKTLLEKAEAAFASGSNHLWLDLQRLIVTACNELGTDFILVRDAVIVETALFLKRIPEIIDLLFADGGACCDDATKDWITIEVQSSLRSGSGTSLPQTADPLTDEQREVNKLAAAGRIDEALTLVQNALHASSNERDNFRRTIMVSSLLLNAKQPEVAISILETLDQKIERHSLDSWDSAICVEAWSALAAAYKTVKAQKPQNIPTVLQDKLTVILSKISLKDPGKAFTLSK